jgi:hypothetical protein
MKSYNSLKERIVRYVGQFKIPVASGEIQRAAANATTYTPRTVVRRLQELANEGRLEVSYVKGHAYYTVKI